MKYYAGIGSRETPADVLYAMGAIAVRLSYKGWTLRSGGAPGADSAFAQGAWDAFTEGDGDGRMLTRPEIYLPWLGFESIGNARLVNPQPETFSIAEQFHPAWDRLSQGAKRLHARNVHQILGPDVTTPLLSLGQLEVSQLRRPDRLRVLPRR